MIEQLKKRRDELLLVCHKLEHMIEHLEGYPEPPFGSEDDGCPGR